MLLANEANKAYKEVYKYEGLVFDSSKRLVFGDLYCEPTLLDDVTVLEMFSTLEGHRKRTQPVTIHPLFHLFPMER